MPTDRFMDHSQNYDADLVPALEATHVKMEEDRAKISDGGQLRLFDYVCEHIFDADFSVQAACRAIGVGREASDGLGYALDVRLSEYVRRRRMTTALQMLKAEIFPPGRIAAAVGYRYEGFMRAYQLETGKVFQAPAMPQELSAGLNYATWLRLERDELRMDEVAHLIDLATRFDFSSPPHRKDDFFIPELARGKNVYLVWLDAVKICAREIARVNVGLPKAIQNLMNHAAKRLCHPDLTVSGAVDAAGVESSISSQIRFYCGESPWPFFQKRRLEIAIHLACLSSLKLPEVAEISGFSAETLRRQCRLRLGVSLAKLRKDAGPSPSSWRRLCLGTATDEDREDVVRILQAKTPSSLEREDASPSIRPWTHIFRTSALDVERKPWEVEENWDAYLRVAQLLSRANPDRTRWEAERHLAGSKYAGTLDRVRLMQSHETAAQALENGEIPRSELWASMLKVRPRPNLQDGVDFEDWLLHERRLVDAKAAVEAAWEADRRRCDLMATGVPLEEIRRNDAHIDYRLACSFLDSEFHHLCGTEAGIGQIVVGLEIGKRLRSPFRHRAPGVLSDLDIFGRARSANCFRALTRIVEAVEICDRLLREGGQVNSPFVAAHTLALAANVYLDQRENFLKANRLIDRAIHEFTAFDLHLASEQMILKAEIQRQQEKTDYLEILPLSIKGIDANRSPASYDAALNNLFYYLIRENRIQEAIKMRRTIAWPQIRAHVASRRMFEGCLDIALFDYPSAEENLKESIDIFIDLKMKSKAALSFLYLAECFSRRDLQELAKEAIAAAYRLTEEQGHRQLCDEIAELAVRQADHIRRLAYKIGGCLGLRQQTEEILA